MDFEFVFSAISLSSMNLLASNLAHNHIDVGRTIVDSSLSPKSYVYKHCYGVSPRFQDNCDLDKM